MKYTEAEIESMLDAMKEIIGNYRDAEDRFNRDEWSKKYGERLGKYSEQLSRLPGRDNSDLLNEAYDEYHSDYSDFSDDEYVDALEENIKKLIDRIWPEMPEEKKEEIAEEVADKAEDGDTEVEIEATDNNPEVEVDGEEITSDERAKIKSFGGKAEKPQEAPKKEFSLIKPRGSNASKEANGWGRTKTQEKKPEAPKTKNGILRSDEACKEPAGGKGLTAAMLKSDEKPDAAKMAGIDTEDNDELEILKQNVAKERDASRR